MATIQRPAKTNGNRTYAAEVASGATTIKASEVDSDYSTIYDEFNGNIDNANVKASAAIGTSKLAQDAGLVNAHLSASAAVAGTKLAVGAAINARQSGAGTTALGDSTGNELTLATATITTRGGRVLIIPTLAYRIRNTSGGSMTLTIRYKRGGVAQKTLIYTGTSSEDREWFGPTPTYDEQPAAGTYTYTFTVQAAGPGTISTHGTAANVGDLVALELT